MAGGAHGVLGGAEVSRGGANGAALDDARSGHGTGRSVEFMKPRRSEGELGREHALGQTLQTALRGVAARPEQRGDLGDGFPFGIREQKDGAIRCAEMDGKGGDACGMSSAGVVGEACRSGHGRFSSDNGPSAETRPLF